MSISLRAFNVGLYTEHLEEASFLYEQCRMLRSSFAITWVKLDDFEQRLEAHLDALVIGGSLALDVCWQRMLTGEPGELFAAVCVVCRHQDARQLAEVWRSLDFADAEKVAAVTEALKQEMPMAWQPACEQALMRGDERLLPILAAVCGARRMPSAEVIMARLTLGPHLIDAQIVMALSRLLLSPTAMKAIEPHAQHESGEVRAATLLALLRSGQRDALKPYYLLAQTEDWPQLALGLAGDHSAAMLLRQRLKSTVVTPDTLYALGLLGDLSVVRALCEYLADEALADAASWALFWITGAALFEDAFIPETVDESTLFAKELTAWREHGEAPKRADGKPFGDTLHRLTRDAARWANWLSDHAIGFDANLRYRRGQPYSLRGVYQGLLDPSVPYRLRQLSYEELVIRFACPVPFEADWLVTKQRQALREIGHWIHSVEGTYRPGGW